MLDDVRDWVIKAIAKEIQKTAERLWGGEPTAEEVEDGRLKRVRFLRGHSRSNPNALRVAERLEACSRGNPCLSGACPECGRFFQRAWVRKSRAVIRSMSVLDAELIAISLVPPKSRVPQGQLQRFDAVNMQRRVKYRFDGADIGVAIGGIDFSFNEDRNGSYSPFWCPHAYIITATNNRKVLASKLTDFGITIEIPRPKKITKFNNIALRRSYSMKMHFHRRIGYDDQRKQEDESIRYFRNSSRDRLRAVERIELFIFLDQIGFAARAIFRGIKPTMRNNGMYFRITSSR
jgi:hypothetical protein